MEKIKIRRLITNKKKAQVTLFAIMGIIMVFSILVLVMILYNLQKKEVDLSDPRQYIESCLREELPRPINRIFEGGGLVNPEKFLLYNGEKFNYLCYSSNFRQNCNILYPQIISVVEKEIKEEIEKNVNACFLNLKEQYVKKGYEFNENELNLTINIVPYKIEAIVDKKIEISREGETQVFENFDSYIDSELYEYLIVVHDIISEEAKFGKFEYIGYSLVNSDYRIRLIEYEDSSIYKIKKVNSDKEFKFATKGMIHWRGK